jgi:hypothetical protein
VLFIVGVLAENCKNAGFFDAIALRERATVARQRKGYGDRPDE